MGSIVKKVLTEFTFRDSVSCEGDIRYLKLKIDTEGCGRFLVLSDESNFDGKGREFCFSSPEDLKILYEAAKELYDQGSIYLDSEDW